MATIKRIGFGQVEPNHLSAQRTAQIYAQLPAAASIKILENGQFVKYDYATGEVNTTGKGEWMLVFNEIKLYDVREQATKDFALVKSDFVDGVITPRVFKTNVGDIYTTNTFAVGNTSSTATVATAAELDEGDELTVNASGFLEKNSSASAGEMVWQVVKIYTLADGQAAAKIMRIK